MIDLLGFALVRAVAFFVCAAPLTLSLGIGRACGALYFHMAGRKRCRAMANLRRAFPDISEAGRRRILRGMYQRFAQNVIEVLYIPRLTPAWIREHIRLEGAEVVAQALARGQGILFLGIHAGSWELSNVTCPILFKDRPYAVLAQTQTRTPRLDAFLNRAREHLGCRVIPVDALKKMLGHLSEGGMLGLIADHGGQDGVPVSFFGKRALTPVGALKLSQRFNAAIVLASMRRVRAAHHILTLCPFVPEIDSDGKMDAVKNLERLNRIFEAWVREAPEEYLWTYKRWKNSPDKDVLVLSDKKAGHVKQSRALAAMIASREGWSVRVEEVAVGYRGPWARHLLAVATRFGGVRLGAALCPLCLTEATRNALKRRVWDIVVSAGSACAAPNVIQSALDVARSIAVMTPGLQMRSRFHLIVMPKHDRPSPDKNIIVTTGALHAVTPDSMSRDLEALLAARPALREDQLSVKRRLGLLIGGDSRSAVLNVRSIERLIEELKTFAAGPAGPVSLYVTTSRRTSTDVERLLRERLNDRALCPLLVIASEDNPDGTVGGLFRMCDALIVSGESISMVSEAAGSGKPVFVFDPEFRGQASKGRRFLAAMEDGHHIRRVAVDRIAARLEEYFKGGGTPFAVWDPRAVLSEALQ